MMTRRRNKPWIQHEGDYDPSDADPHLKGQDIHESEPFSCCPQCDTGVRVGNDMPVCCPTCGCPLADSPVIFEGKPPKKMGPSKTDQSQIARKKKSS